MSAVGKSVPRKEGAAKSIGDGTPARVLAAAAFAALGAAAAFGSQPISEPPAGPPGEEPCLAFSAASAPVVDDHEAFRVFPSGGLFGAARFDGLGPAASDAPAPEPAPEHRGLRNAGKPFGTKLLRGEIIIGGVEALSLGILLAMPRSTTKWDPHPFAAAGAHLKRAWTQPPVWDKDAAFHDYVGHPYAGSVYYNMVRSQDATPLESFLFSTLQCVLFEYVIEAVAEQPSKQDLLITSTVGSLLGEVIHRLTLRMVQKPLNFWKKALILFLNPSYVANNGFRAP